MELDVRSVSELRAELEVATARLREELQGQLWNYYGALRDPAAALKERVELLEEKLEDLVKLEGGSGQQVDLRELQSQVASIGASESASCRQLAGLQVAQQELEEQLNVQWQRQELYLKDVQNDLRRELLRITGSYESRVGEAQGLKERLDELMRSNETQLELLRRHEETTGTVQQQAGALAAALQGLQEKVAVAQQSLQDLRGEADRQKISTAQTNEALNTFKAELQQQSRQGLEVKSQLETKLRCSGAQLGELQRSLEGWRKEMQEQLQGQLENQEAAVQKMQTSLVSRMERCQLEVLKKVDHQAYVAENKIEKLQANAGEKALDGEVAKELRKLEAKMDREPLEKLSLDLQAVKQGVESLRNSVAPRSISPCRTGPLVRPCARCDPVADVAPEPPKALRIFCPVTPGLPAISGEYQLVPGECPNGRPLWKQKAQELWLYCGTNQRWFVGGPDAKEWKFRCEAGFIYSEVVKGGSPDESKNWARFQGGIFVSDPHVTVTRCT